MTALHSAKITAPASDGKPDRELLKQLSTALSSSEISDMTRPE